MKEQFNWDSLNQKTKIAGVVGHPVDHSLSPIMHNQAYKQMGLDAIYLKFDVPAAYEDFAFFIEAVRSRPWLDCVGFSVTIPHKTNAIRYLKERNFYIDPLAQKIGAVNTLVFNPDNTVAGYNTDYYGILETLRTAEAKLEGKRIAVLGAGGVSRAIVAALTDCRAEVTIFNRTELKAKLLADEFSCKYLPWENRNTTDADIIINGTSIGMDPNIGESPLDEVRPGTTIFDTVYNPLETKLIKFAKAAGAQTISGADMLVFQAAKQINLWFTGKLQIPVDIMRMAVLSKLKK